MSWKPAEGDRVVLKPDPSWKQPFRRFAEEGRRATVIRLGGLMARLEFDVKRSGAKPHYGFFHPKDLLPTPNENAPGEPRAQV